MYQNGALFSSSSSQWTTNGTNIHSANTGNVGIGTTAPTAKLHVAGNLGAVIGGGGSSIKMTNTDTGNFASIGAGLVGYSNAGLDFSVDGSRKMVIAGNGNVGIGTTSPTRKLDVAGDINFTGDLYQNGVTFLKSTNGGANVPSVAL